MAVENEAADILVDRLDAAAHVRRVVGVANIALRIDAACAHLKADNAVAAGERQTVRQSRRSSESQTYVPSAEV